MTNREKYAEEIFDIACSGEALGLLNGHPVPCTSFIGCEMCGFYDEVRGCKHNIINWCNSDYIPNEEDEIYNDQWKIFHIYSWRNNKYD